MQQLVTPTNSLQHSLSEKKKQRHQEKAVANGVFTPDSWKSALQMRH